MKHSKPTRRDNRGGQTLFLNRSDISHQAIRNLAEKEPEQNVITSFRWGWYLLSLFIPFAGILVALILYDQDSREVRKVGRNCLFIGFFIWVVFPVLVILGLLFLGAMAALSWVSDMMPSAD
jgi:hypothetical protein